MSIWELTVSGLITDTTEDCEVTVAWRVLPDHYDSINYQKGRYESTGKVEVTEVMQVRGTVSGADYTVKLNACSYLKEHLEEMIAEKLEV